MSETKGTLQKVMNCILIFCALFSIEITVLLMRSVVPVHPICAAIQSIGIVRRDVEGEAGFGIGKAILPAFLLHGLFDFAIMTLAVIANAESLPSDDNTTNGSVEENPTIAVLSVIVGLALLVIGLLYYFIMARKQRERLNALESVSAHAVTTNHLIV